MSHVRRLLIAALVLAAVGNAGAAEPPVCGGRDLWQDAAAADVTVDRAKVERMAEGVANARAVFWRLEAPNGGPVSHILGTVHLTDPRITTLDAKVIAGLDDAQVVAFENRAGIDRDQMSKTLAKVGPALFMADGGNYGQLLDADGLDRLRAALDRRSLPLFLVYGWKPEILIFSVLAYPPCELARHNAGELILDAKILAEAKQRRRETADLETMDEQFAALSDVPMPAQVDQLLATLTMDARAEDYQATALGFYLSRRLDLMWAFYNTIAASLAHDPGHIDQIWATMLDRRNQSMFANALRLATAKRSFIAVGAAHLIGDKGLVQRFKDAGFKVEAEE
ncbi:MAG: TraB/GumN family protein [Ancalomicrobiaceae bacterium]|nr:TraB/GumN family protein [Ancalomicrobiaceae bacterium]